MPAVHRTFLNPIGQGSRNDCRAEHRDWGRDQLINASEKRLAPRWSLLARYGKPDGPRHGLPALSQEVLAEMVGTTRSRVKFFMNKFRKLGFIDYNKDGLKVHHTLLGVVLHDFPASDL